MRTVTLEACPWCKQFPQYFGSHEAHLFDCDRRDCNRPKGCALALDRPSMSNADDAATLWNKAVVDDIATIAGTHVKAGSTEATPAELAEPHWVNIIVSGAEALDIIAGLGADHPIAARLRRRLSEDSTQCAEAFREAASAAHAKEGKIEIDNGAPISEGEDGAYVNAWVWVPWSALPQEHWPAHFGTEEDM